MLVDLLLLGTIILVAAAGFFHGTIKLLLALLMFYASLLLAGLYYNFAALAFVERGANPVLAQAFSFFLILVVAFMLLLVAAVYTFRYVRLPARLDVLDRMLGTGVGILFGFAVTCILALVLRYAFITHDLAGDGGFALMRMLQSSTRSASLVPLLLGRVFPPIYVLIAPFLPDTARVLFTPGV
jgi:membrane protein required for colicin V production